MRLVCYLLFLLDNKYLSCQHHPPDSFGFQKLFNKFSTNNFDTENGKEVYFPKGGKGFEGEPGVPPISCGFMQTLSHNSSRY